MLTVPDFSNLTFLELLFLFVSLPGMIFLAALVSDAFRNLIKGERLNPTSEALGKWLRSRTPLALQWLVIGAQVVLPILAYAILAAWVDATLREIEQIYRFLKDLLIAVIVGKAYYQYSKSKPQSVIQYITQNNAANSGAEGGTFLNAVATTSPAEEAAPMGKEPLHVPATFDVTGLTDSELEALIAAVSWEISSRKQPPVFNMAPELPKSGPAG